MDKRQILIELMQSGEVKAILLDKVSRGKYARLLLKGKNISDRKVDEMYKNFEEIQKKEKVTENPVKEEKTKSLSLTWMVTETSYRELQKQVTELQKQVTELQKQVTELQKQVTELQK